jgi:F0F1-type ATP synthase assembly protein I
MPEQPQSGNAPDTTDPESGIKKDSGLVLAIKYSHIGFALPAGTVVGWMIGAALDHWLGTKWIGTAGLIVGIIAGFAELIRAATQLSKESK